MKYTNSLQIKDRRAELRKQADGIITTAKREVRELTDDERDDLDEAYELQSISRMPARVKCAELAWRTLEGMV